MRTGIRSLALAAVAASACSVMPVFENEPQCTSGQSRTRDYACGPCTMGTASEECGPGARWVVTACSDPTDEDNDGYPNLECAGRTVDCNDGDAAVYPGATGSEECTAGSTDPCTSSCGTAGTRGCSAACAWGDCTPPREACGNAVDDDCDTQTDEIEEGQCDPGIPAPCTTICGSTGTGTCTTACLPAAPADCISPLETCNAADDDCDDATDEDFDCVPGAEVDCLTTCGSAGRGTCTDACTVPAVADCRPPVESCNGRDDDCDATCDEDSECCAGTTESCTTGAGGPGLRVCSAGCGWGPCEANSETCNGLDDDGDTETDEGYPCARGLTTACTTGCGSTGSGTCTETCDRPVDAACTPPVDACNGLDDDCDTVCDDDGGICCAGVSESCTVCGGPGTRTCNATCDRRSACTRAEVCNGCDDDADGTCDDGAGVCCYGATASCTIDSCPGERTCNTVCDWGACVGTGPGPTAAPALVVPHNGAYTGSIRAPSARQTLRPEFRWTGVTGCGTITYQIQLDDSCSPGVVHTCSFPSPEIDVAGIAGTTYRPAADLAVSSSVPVGRRYHWRVRGCDGGGTCGPWSMVRYVEVGRVPADFNGDGASDVLLTWNNGGGEMTALFLGGSSDTTADVRPGTGGGAPVWVGDANADGFADFMDGPVLYLGARTPDGTADVTFTPGALDSFFNAFAGAGDVNGDGYSDLAIASAGALSSAGGLTAAGRVYVYFGGSSVNTTADVTVIGSSRDEYLGAGLQAAGDMNNDGYADVLIGQGFGSSPGALRLLLGAASPDATLDVTFTASSGCWLRQKAAGGAGDVNGDGYADLLVGCVNEGTAGATKLYLGGSPVNAVLDWQGNGEATNDDYGTAVAAAGDLNGDGFGDVVIGAPLADGAVPLRDRGRAYLYLGRSSFAPGSPDTTITGTVDFGNLSDGVAGVGDVNGDGYADLAVGVPYTPNAYVYYGGSTLDTTADLTIREGASAGRAIAIALW
ncbi:MAG: FG-GAP repeat protein [Deltaproteobacteria bacterium]|nr:FG-GAP repeat protein [Deltaproteobacteria bacterium]